MNKKNKKAMDLKLKNVKKWNEYVNANNDAYGGSCVKVARKVMELLDKDPTPLHNGYNPDIHTAHGLICKADDDTNAGEITGFMAGCVVQMVFECHERGDEFRRSHNGETETEGVVNHALLTIESKKHRSNKMKEPHGKLPNVHPK